MGSPGAVPFSLRSFDSLSLLHAFLPLLHAGGRKKDRSPSSSFFATPVHARLVNPVAFPAAPRSASVGAPPPGQRPKKALPCRAQNHAEKGCCPPELTLLFTCVLPWFHHRGSTPRTGCLVQPGGSPAPRQDHRFGGDRIHHTASVASWDLCSRRHRSPKASSQGGRQDERIGSLVPSPCLMMSGSPANRSVVGVEGSSPSPVVLLTVRPGTSGASTSSASRGARRRRGSASSKAPGLGGRCR